MDEPAKQKNDVLLAAPDPRLAQPAEAGVAWIHSLAGEWQRRERDQNPQALAGALLLK